MDYETRLRLAARTYLGVLLGFMVTAIGCSEPKQAAQVEQLKSQLQDADRRLEVANQQLESAVDHSSQLERAMQAAKQEAADAKSQSQAEVKRFELQLRAIQGELQVATDRLAEIARKERDEADRVNPVGAWVGVDAWGKQKRFLFFAGGRGVFYSWDVDSQKWWEGSKGGEGLASSDGRFDYTHDGARGEYSLRYTEQRNRLREMRRPTGGGVPKTAEENTAVELQLIMRSSDEALLVGGGADTVLTRVDETWTPDKE